MLGEWVLNFLLGTNEPDLDLLVAWHPVIGQVCFATFFLFHEWDELFESLTATRRYHGLVIDKMKLIFFQNKLRYRICDYRTLCALRQQPAPSYANTNTWTPRLLTGCRTQKTLHGLNMPTRMRNPVIPARDKYTHYFLNLAFIFVWRCHHFYHHPISFSRFMKSQKAIPYTITRVCGSGHGSYLNAALQKQKAELVYLAFHGWVGEAAG